MAENVIEEVIVAEAPRTVSSEQTYVYIPIATGTKKGIAAFDPSMFVVTNGMVYLKVPYLDSNYVKTHGTSSIVAGDNDPAQLNVGSFIILGGSGDNAGKIKGTTGEFVNIIVTNDIDSIGKVVTHAYFKGQLGSSDDRSNIYIINLNASGSITVDGDATIRDVFVRDITSERNMYTQDITATGRIYGVIGASNNKKDAFFNYVNAQRFFGQVGSSNNNAVGYFNTIYARTVNADALLGPLGLSNVNYDAYIKKLVVKDVANFESNIVMSAGTTLNGATIIATVLKVGARSVGTYLDKVDDIEEKIPSQASSSNQLADKNFVNSSIENVAAYYETDSTKKPFATKAALNAMTANQFYSGDTQRVPTRNDYTIVESDESNPLEMQGYTQWDATSDYVGAYVLYNGNYTLVTDANKDSLGIVAGTTKAYTLPTTRYVYLGAPDTAYNSANWALQWVVNATGYTAAQIDAINSGITAALVAQITANANNITGLQNRLPAGDNGTLATQNYVGGELKNYLPTAQIKTLFINQIGNTYVYDKLTFIVQITAEDFDEPDPTNGVHIVLDGNGTIQWGDGQSEDFESGGVDHSYGAAGVYVIYIDGATGFNASDTHIVSATIPSTFAEIPADAFKNNTGLMSVMIPSSVTSIGAGAFDGITDQTFKEIFFKGNAVAWVRITVGTDNDIIDDLNDPNPTVSTQLYFMTDGYEVKYITQTLDATQKAQARQNIGAQEAGSYVPTSRTIAGNALTNDISAQTLTDSLILCNNTTDIEYIMEDE